MATAQVLFQRFYYSKSFINYSVQVGRLVDCVIQIWWSDFISKYVIISKRDII